jgi:hypothetical protein
METMTDNKGRQVPINMVSDLDKLKDQTVRDITSKALHIQAMVRGFRQEVKEDMMSYLALSFERYGKKYGGQKGNISLTSFDGSLKVVLAVAESITFDERLQIAKAIVDECITRWAEGSRDEIRALVNDAFNVDKAGKISTSRVLSLRRLAIQDPEWQRAMEAISESIQVSGSKEYLRIYTRDGEGKYQPISLDIAAL